MRVHRLLGSMALLAAFGMSFAGPAQAQNGTQAVVPEGDTFTLKLAASEPAAASAQTATVQFIGTATVLIRYQGLTILTDPNFLHKGEHVHLGYGLTSQRQTNPAIAFDQLPPIDLVILSHMHDDHFDKLVQERLNRNTPIVSTREASEALKRLGFQQRFALSDWDRLEVTKGDTRLRITTAPARHGAAGVSVLLPTVMGSMLDFGANSDAPDYRMYVSGDTLVYDDIRSIAQRFPGIDLALLHLGGTRILGAFKVTMDGKDGVQMMQIVKPKKTIPIHYNDYDVFKSPLSEFAREVKAAGLDEGVVYLAHGDTYIFTPRKR